MNKSQLIIKKTGESGNDTDMSKEKKTQISAPEMMTCNMPIKWSVRISMTMRNYIQAYVSSIFRITSIGFLIIKFPVNLGELSGGETLCGFHLVRETVSISRL